MALRTVVGVASIASGIIFIAAVSFVGYMFNDINSFFDESLNGLEDFKMTADGAWNKMIDSTSTHSVRSERSALRQKKSSEEGCGCNCGEQPNNCPSGPPGPPGAPGTSGEDGTPGEPGRDGTNGISLATYSKNGGCIKCPAGPPGIPGPTGAPGTLGANGKDGEHGRPGKDGQPGQQGAPGDAGVRGNNGSPGSKGAPGANGKRGKGLPGASGPQGPPGQPGQPGKRGQDGLSGQRGKEGLAGASGKPGAAGKNGEVGTSGGAGQPGPDAAYCPCPPRTDDLDVLQVEPATKKNEVFAPALRPPHGHEDSSNSESSEEVSGYSRRKIAKNAMHRKQAKAA